MLIIGQNPTLILPIGDTFLVWPQPPTNLPTLQDFNVLSPEGAGCNVYLPNATLAQTVQEVKVWNLSGDHPINIYKFGGGDPLIQLEPGAIYMLDLYENGTEAGEWTALPFVNGVNNITNFTIESAGNTIDVTDGVVNTSGSIVNLEVASSLKGLASPDAITVPGIVVANTTGGPTSPTYTSRVLASDGNIIITNPDGSDGAPYFALNSILQSLTAVTAGNTTITANSITNVNPININGATFALGGVITGNLQSPNIPIAWVRFNDAVGTLVIQDSFNVAAVIPNTTEGAYSIELIIPATNANYGIVGTCGTGSTITAPLFVQPIYSSCTTNVCAVVVTDSGGTVVDSIPNGITLVIYSSLNAVSSLGLAYGGIQLSSPGEAQNIIAREWLKIDTGVWSPTPNINKLSLSQDNTRITSETTGTFLVSLSVTCAARNFNPGSIFTFALYKNGNYFIDFASPFSSLDQNGKSTTLSSVIMVLANEGDYFELYVTAKQNITLEMAIAYLIFNQLT